VKFRMKGFIILLLILSNFISVYAMIGRRASLLTPRISRFIDLRYRKCSASSVIQGASDSSVVSIGDIDVAPKEKAKRKIAFSIAFVGSNYHGLQLDMHSGVPTVEAEVESALYKLGCIHESNHLDLSKISWSRSSRTDKRVHCARLVISAKLEIPLDWLSETEVRIPFLVEHMNQILPPDIRLLSVCKINQSFRAREACSWREYEYVMPKSFLYSKSATSNTDNANAVQSAEEERSAIELFKKTLKRMEGNMSFHNFHRVSTKNLKRREFAPRGEEEGNSRYNNRNVDRQSNPDAILESSDQIELSGTQQQQPNEAESESSLTTDSAFSSEAGYVYAYSRHVNYQHHCATYTLHSALNPLCVVCLTSL
jgi:tRNA pseudouridine(38-40) synthase